MDSTSLVRCAKPDSGEHLQSVFLHDGKQLERHAAGLFRAGLPLLHRGLTGVQVAGEDRLTDTMALTKLLDLARLDGRRNQAGSVEVTHGGLVDRAYSEQIG